MTHDFADFAQQDIYQEVEEDQADITEEVIG